jgi:macrolide transport system ATP-binding/permease protein
MANKVRTVLSMLGILIGVSAVIAMLAIGTGAKMEIEKQLASMGSNLLITRAGSQRLHGVAMQAGATARLTLDDVEEIRRKIPLVSRISGTVSGRGQLTWGGKNWNTQLMGVHPEYAEIRLTQADRGRFFTQNELRRRARVAVVGLTVVKQLFGDSDPVGEYIKVNKIPFLIVGVQKEKGATGFWDQDDVILIPISTAMYRVLGKQYIDSIETEICSASEIPEAEKQIQQLLINIHRVPPSLQEDAFNVRNMAEFRDMLIQTSKTMSTLLSAIAAVSLLVGGIGIMNIMLVSVTERTREIGLRKAVGAKRRDILAQFLTEALTISFLGGAIGILIGWTVSLAVSKFAGWATSVTFSSILLAVGFSVLVGIIFGLWPAMKAARQNPIEALRYE